VVELLTGVAYISMWHFFASDLILLALYLILISVLILIIVYDLRHTIIPDELTMMVGGIAVVLLAYTYIVTKDLSYVYESVGAGLGAATFFWGLWYVSKGKWIGLGDAKLALPLGVIVGIGGVFSMVVFSFWIGAVLSLTFLGIEKLLKRGKTHLSFLGTPLTMKSEVPFAPFLIAAFLLVQLLHADIFTLTYTVLFSG
jgi:prepilin signal peptidase PulO-like enzyme (type II secretory pathway)